MPSDNGRTGYLATQRVDSVPEAKLRIKELKLKKKEYQAAKRELTSQIVHLRAIGRSMTTYTRMPIRVPGRMGKAMRAGAQAVGDMTRAGGAATIRALEYQKGQLDQQIAHVDRAILQLERYILANG